jgi:hypothetical protein
MLVIYQFPVVNNNIIYFTEKGVDLSRAIPEIAQMEYALQQGYNWYDIMHRPALTMRTPAPCTVVFTTESALETQRHAKIAQYAAKIVEHVQSSNQPITRDCVVDFTVEQLCSVDSALHTDIMDSVISTLAPHIVEIPLPVESQPEPESASAFIEPIVMLPALPVSPPQTPTRHILSSVKTPMAPRRRNRHKSFVTSMLQQSKLTQHIQPVVFLNLLDAAH